MRIKILTEGGKNIGLGHLSRCSSLYYEGISRGISIEFIVCGDVSEVEFLKDTIITNVNWIDEEYIKNNISGCDYVIIDSYMANREIYEYVSKIAKKTLFIDDIGRISYPEGIILNPCIDVSGIDYSNQSPNSILLYGPEYVIIRPQFRDMKKNDVSKKIDRIMITMGGTDIRGLTSMMIEGICIKLPDINYDIVVGTNSCLESVKWIEGDDNIKIHTNIDAYQMMKVILDSDLVITAAGQTIYELISTGTPFIPIQVIENQKYTVAAILKNNIVNNVFSWETDNLTDRVLEDIGSLEEQSIRKEIMKRYSKVIDGNGAVRIIDELMR